MTDDEIERHWPTLVYRPFMYALVFIAVGAAFDIADKGMVPAGFILATFAIRTWAERRLGYV